MVEAVESRGAVPAITAVVCGEVALGITAPELERFLERDHVHKVSTRDLGVAVAKNADGATTVAAAIAIAALAGARVLATGGIGGVHRGGSGVRDESADLEELARTPVVVVCAGAKTILDLPATWERLDTLGVPVIGVGTAEFPGFFTTHTGIPLSATASGAAEVARIAAAHFALGRAQSVLVVQPPPAHVALDADVVARAVDMALSRAVRDGVRGGAVTPYLLAEVSKETGGQSLATNLALLEANAALAAEIAGHLSRVSQ